MGIDWEDIIANSNVVDTHNVSSKWSSISLIVNPGQNDEKVFRTFRSLPNARRFIHAISGRPGFANLELRFA